MKKKSQPAAARKPKAIHSREEILELRQMESVFRESQRFFSTLMKNLPGMAYRRRHDRQDILEFVSEGCQALTGYPPAHLILNSHRLYTRLIHPDDRSRIERATQDAVRERRPFRLVYRLATADGTIKWVLEQGQALYASDGRPQAIEGFVTDISEMKSMEQVLLKAQKLESLGTLIQGLTHDFNNLLQIVLGNIELLGLTCQAGSAQKESLSAIRKAGLRMVELTGQLQSYSGSTRSLFQPLETDALLRKMEPLIRTAISKQHQLRWQLASPLPRIHADPNQVRQLVMNLLANATEAIGEQPGVITISAGSLSSDRLSPADFLFLETPPENGEWVFLAVADTGSGMDPTILPHIFDPFFSTKFMGRGLGLAAVQGIVRAHHGAIRVQSTPGKGTVFTVIFPLSHPAANQPRADTPATSGTTILLVDDEEGVRAVAARILEQAGFKVMLAVDGHTALALFQSHFEKIALILLDMTMPSMDGSKTLREIRRLSPHVPVLLLSGHANIASEIAGKDAQGFIQKPFMANELIEAITPWISP